MHSDSAQQSHTRTLPSPLLRRMLMLSACRLLVLRRPDTPVKSMASPFKFQSRCIALFPDQTGFALGSIEGRVSIQYISDPPAPAQPAASGEPQPDPRNFAFKCTLDAAHCSVGRQQSCVGSCV